MFFFSVSSQSLWPLLLTERQMSQNLFWDPSLDFLLLPFLPLFER